jgi:hypothetical protein
MRWDARGTIALLISALVGIAAGVVLGFSTGNPDPSSADPDAPDSSPSASSDPEDPANLGVPLENLDCNGEHVLVVGWGDQDRLGDLFNAVSSNPDGVKYLQTSQSCNTTYRDPDEPRPDYIAYLGPFDSIAQPCSMAMTPEHMKDTVANLKNGVNAPVTCLCALDPVTFPTLKVGMRATTKDGIYIRALQRLLITIDRNPQERVNGRYDRQTAALVRPLQRVDALDPRLYGKVETQTWQLLKDRACLSFDF